MEERVWASEDGTGWYLLPEDARLPEGDHLIRDLLGRSRLVERGALGTYVIAKDRADDLARVEILRWMSKIGAATSEVAHHLEQRRPGSGAALATLKGVVDGVVTRLAKPGDVPPRVEPPGDLLGKIEGYVRGLSEDPAKIEGLKKMTRDLEEAAARFRELTPKKKG